MNVRWDVAYELALESQARIREHARSGWKVDRHRVAASGKGDGRKPAAEPGEGLGLAASLASDGGAV